MKSFNLSSFEALPKTQPRILIIGAFDGVHRGHQQLIHRASRIRDDRAGELVVLTFWPLPDQVLRNGSLTLLTTEDQRRERLAALNVDALVTLEFTRAFAAQSPEYFADWILSRRLRADHVAVGFNFFFGRGGSGTPEYLELQGRTLGYEVSVLPSVTLEGQRVSSTAIRELLSAGNVEAAQRMLGRAHELVAQVVPGDSRGERLGYPTANVWIPKPLSVPRPGVYQVEVDTQHRSSLPALAHVGGSPTYLKNPAPRLIEVHLVEDRLDLYGQEIRIRFNRWIRPPMTFSSASELIAQIQRDLRAVEARRLQ